MCSLQLMKPYNLRYHASSYHVGI